MVTVAEGYEEIQAGTDIHFRLAEYAVSFGAVDFVPKNSHELWALDTATNPSLEPVTTIEISGYRPYMRVFVRSNNGR